MRYKIKQKVYAATAFVVAVVFTGCSSGYSTPDIAPHFILSPEAEPVRPIDGWDVVALSAYDGGELTSEEYRMRVDELYSTVVYDRKQPVFAENDPVRSIYTAARSILDRYILNSWHGSSEGEYNIVHTIHDWLVSNIDYDFELYNSYWQGDDALALDPAFYIDGVFLNGKAVCDGLSRAFDFLCAIEDITSVRVTGAYGLGPHAWNKVNIGGEWYNIDTTADIAYYRDADGQYKKQLSHGYFLLSDKTLSTFAPNGHTFEAQPYIAEQDFDYYSVAAPTITIKGMEYNSVIRSEQELYALFEAVNNAKGEIGKLEVKLDFDGKVQVNIADMYTAEIKNAYSKINNPAYDINSGAMPYFRYPNGVYLFLIYK